MNKPQIERALDSIARKEIKDDMDLWPNIQSKLKTDRNQWLRPIGSLTRYAAVAVLALFSVVAYAFYQQNDTNDPGLDRVRANDLITELGMSQTQNDLTVTLDWAYADAHRVALSYSASNSSDQNFIDVTRRLTDIEGNEIPPAFGGGGGGGGGNDGQPRISEALANYDLSGFDFTGRDSIDLHLEITYGNIAFPEEMPEGGMSGNAGGGGGGGGGGGANPPANMPGSSEFTEPLTFMFDFSLPMIQAVRVEMMETSQGHDVQITLEWMAFTPSLTHARICHDLAADDETMWMPVSSITIPTEAEPMVISETRMLPDTEQSNCYILEYLAPFDGSTEGWVLTVDRLQTQIQNYDTAAIIAALQAAGVDVQRVDGGFTIVGEQDANNNIESIIRETEDTMREILEGPWTFQIDIP